MAEPSKLDAMGQDKRRKVVGHAYGPSRRSQAVFFVAVAAVAVLVLGGWTIAVATLDRPPDSYPDRAPWSESDARQVPTLNPSNPCGEPGNPHPPPQDSPCANEAGPSGSSSPGAG